MTMKHDEVDLEAVFEAARAAPPQPSNAFLSRLIAEAETEQDQIAVSAPVLEKRQPLRFAWFSVLRDGLGGWPGLAGVSAACATGVWLGFAPPAYLPDVAQLLYSSDNSASVFATSGLILEVATDEG